MPSYWTYSATNYSNPVHLQHDQEKQQAQEKARQRQLAAESVLSPTALRDLLSPHLSPKKQQLSKKDIQERLKKQLELEENQLRKLTEVRARPEPRTCHFFRLISFLSASYSRSGILRMQACTSYSYSHLNVIASLKSCLER